MATALRFAALLCSMHAIAHATIRHKSIPEVLRSWATGFSDGFQPPPSFSNSSPCGLDPEHMAKNVNISGDWKDAERLEDGNRRNLKFYLHVDGIFNMAHILDCFFDHMGTARELDLHLLPNDAEHAGDEPLIRLMSVHKDRTWNEDEAAIHVIGAPLQTAWLASKNSNCVNESYLLQREHDILNTLRDMKSFQEAPEKFVFIDSDWRMGAFGKELLDVVQNNSTLAGGDLAFTAHAHQSIIIPYLTNFKLDKAAHDFASNLISAPSLDSYADLDSLAQRRRQERPISFHLGMDHPRNTNVVFNGNFRNGRSILLNLTEDMADIDVQEVFFRDYSISEMAKHTMKTADTMLHSKLCLVPNGDTKTTRRLFDALAAGCVPIYVGGTEGMMKNLPFKNTIRWGDIAIFAGTGQCLMNRLPEAKTWLASLLAETPETFFHIERMRRLGQAVYAKYLSYTSEDMVGAFLGQFDESGNTV